MRFFEKDLRVKVTVILLSLVLAASVAALIVSYTLMSSTMTTHIDESMLDSARMTRNLLEVGLERRATRMQLLANYPVLRDRTSDPASKAAALELFIEFWPIGRGAVFIDTGGNIICGTGKLGTIGNATGTTWFDNAQTAKITFTYIQQQNELTGIFFDAPVLAVSSPARDSKEEIHGYIVGFTALSDIRKAIDGVKVDQTGHGFLVDGSGNLIAGRLVGVGQRATNEDKQSVEELIDKMTRGAGGKATLSYKHDKYLVTYTSVEQTGTPHPELDWAVGVIVPGSEAYAPANDVAWALIGLTAIILVGAVVASILLSRGITRPIAELAATAERIGSGDLTGEVVIGTRDQIGTLAAAFLRMRDHLRGTLGEATYSSDKMSLLAEEQLAATRDVFENVEEIVESVIVLAKNMEAQTQKVRKITELTRRMPDEVLSSDTFQEVRELLREMEILSEVGAGKSVEIASATQDQRAAARDVAAAARRLNDMARELNDMVQRFKV